MIYQKIWQKLSSYKNLVLLSGPRQSGKTTFAKIIARNYTNQIYYNWDDIPSKRQLIQDPYFFEKIDRMDETMPLVMFDEIHKYSNWKNYLKGVYDRFAGEYQFLVTGSGRLDLYQKGGDSLAGRYLKFHLLPFTYSELTNKQSLLKDFLNNPFHLQEDSKTDYNLWNDLFEFSGFPEPFLKGEKEFYRLWSNNYQQQLIREDVRDLTQIKKFDSLEILYSLLPLKVGSPLSLSSLHREVQVTVDSIKTWLEVFENYYLLFRIPPWTHKISRAIKKDKKLYLFDYAQISNTSARFENMIALELYRAVLAWNALGWGDFSLNYIRNKEKEEVDFLICENHQPILLIECKLSDENVSNALIKFQNKINVPAIQLVNKKHIGRIITNQKNKVLITSAPRWLSFLP
ncbi:MAG: ATP-binding protein [Atribacterota bacterium]|nr:ATP-binding protein [Atribacterota bacterium]